MTARLHEMIRNFYVRAVKPLFCIEAKGNEGWNKISSVNKTDKQELYEIRAGGKSIVCTKDHVLICKDGSEVLASQALGHSIQLEDGTIAAVGSVLKLGKTDNTYDVSLDGNHLYYANGILSHNCVIADEFSFVPNNISHKVFESIYPVISSSKNSQFIIVSTPNGADTKNLYYELWCKANAKTADKNVEGWKPFRFDWWDVPGRDEQWKANTIASIGEQRFSQEFGNEFMSMGTVKKLIPEDVLERYRMKQTEMKLIDKDLLYGKKQKILNEAQDKFYEFTTWHEFNPKKTYLASGDVAEGVGSDSSILYIWDVTDLSNIIQCAKFSSNSVSTVEFAFVTTKILALYNNPYYICERNGIGSGYLDSLRITYGYPNLVKEGKGGEAGVFSHVTTKGRACLWAREMMTTAGFGWTLYDRELLDELDLFTKKDTRSNSAIYQAIAPAHDDCVLAWIWACFVLQPDLVERYFICVDTFISQLEKTYPKALQPLKEYVDADLRKVEMDPLHREFLDFKDEIQHKLGKAIFDEEQEAKADVFQRLSQKPDQFFGDFDGPSWNCPNPANAALSQQTSRQSSFFVL